jgi:hypothetical protein
VRCGGGRASTPHRDTVSDKLDINNMFSWG